MREYSARQLCALSVTALAGPLLLSCAAVPWIWVLAAALVAALYYIYIVWVNGKLPQEVGYGRLLRIAWGRHASAVLLVLYGVFNALSAAFAAKLCVTAFPLDRGFPVIPVVLLCIGAWVASKGAAAVCRFGGILYFFVLIPVAAVIAFALPEVKWVNLRQMGSVKDAITPLGVFLLPVAGLFFRDRVRQGEGSYLKWFLNAALLAVACSIVTVGSLGLPLAQAVEEPFYHLTKSISVLGVMERFEAFVSALLTISFGCLMAYFMAIGRKITCSGAPNAPVWVTIFPTLAVALVAMWFVPYVPDWVWGVGIGLFWGILPVITLAVVSRKKSKNKC